MENASLMANAEWGMWQRRRSGWETLLPPFHIQHSTFAITAPAGR
jgi:hypothetical protein